MSTYVWPNGLGGATGEELGTCKPLVTSGNVWFVDSVTGSADNSGLDPTVPKATLATAVAAASDADIIVLLATHNETITSGITITLDGLTIVGWGTAAGKPTAKLTRNFAGILFTWTGNSGALRNVNFPVSGASTSDNLVQIAGTGSLVSDCYFDVGANDTGATVNIASGANGTSIIDTTFVSTVAPASPIQLSGNANDITLDGVVVDGGSTGWGGNYGIDLSAHVIARLRGISLSLLRGSDMAINASTTGYVNVQTSTGSSKVLW